MKSEEMKKKRQKYLDDEMKSLSNDILYFVEEQIEILIDAIVDNGIITEETHTLVKSGKYDDSDIGKDIKIQVITMIDEAFERALTLFKEHHIYID